MVGGGVVVVVVIDRGAKAMSTVTVLDGLRHRCLCSATLETSRDSRKTLPAGCVPLVLAWGSTLCQESPTADRAVTGITESSYRIN